MAMRVADRNPGGQALRWAGIVAGASYMLVGPIGLAGPAAIAWKGAGVALLAAWAAVNARNADGWLFATVLVLCAIGDVLIDAIGLMTGGIAFAGAHLLAILLYARNRRGALSPSQRTLGILTPVAAVVMTVAMLAGRPGVVHIAAYAAIVGSMAGMAWTSRFLRYRTGVGAMLFLTSDLLIFARMGPLAGSSVPDMLVWPFYFAGQALIAAGVVAASIRTRELSDVQDRRSLMN